MPVVLNIYYLSIWKRWTGPSDVESVKSDPDTKSYTFELPDGLIFPIDWADSWEFDATMDHAEWQQGYKSRAHQTERLKEMFCLIARSFLSDSDYGPYLLLWEIGGKVGNDNLYDY